MKKPLTLLTIAVLLCSICSAALAEPFYLEDLGASIEVPDGMTGQDASTDEYYALGVSVNGNPNLGYVYIIQYMEELEGLWMEDLSDEEGYALLEGISRSLSNPSFGGTEINGYKVLVAADETGTQLHYILLINGWLCDIAAIKNDGVVLSDDEIQAAAEMLISIEFE